MALHDYFAVETYQYLFVAPLHKNYQKATPPSCNCPPKSAATPPEAAEGAAGAVVWVGMESVVTIAAQRCPGLLAAPLDQTSLLPPGMPATWGARESYAGAKMTT